MLLNRLQELPRLAQQQSYLQPAPPPQQQQQRQRKLMLIQQKSEPWMLQEQAVLARSVQSGTAFSKSNPL